MCSPGINGERELRVKQANPCSPGKMAIKTECVCVCGGSENAVTNCDRQTPVSLQIHVLTDVFVAHIP